MNGFDFSQYQIALAPSAPRPTEAELQALLDGLPPLRSQAEATIDDAALALERVDAIETALKDRLASHIGHPRGVKPETGNED